jgi:hypothetical protein
MVALFDSELRAVWAAANGLPVEKRGIFLGRLIAQLQLRGFRFSNADLDDVARRALTGLIQGSAALNPLRAIKPR